MEEQRPARLGAMLLGLAVLSPAAWTETPADVVEEECREAGQELVPDLLELAEWCSSEKLYAFRNDVYRLVIELEPDEPVARKGLKYSRNADGDWVQPRPNKVKNRNPRAEGEYRTMLGRTIAPYRSAVIAIMRRHGLSPFDERGQRILEGVLTVDPDDAQVRRILRQVKLGDTWVLEETYLGRERRLELGSYSKAALVSAFSETKDEALNATDELVDIGWTGAVRTPTARVVGLVPQDELRQIAQATHAAAEFFRDVFERDVDYWTGATFYLLPDETLRDTFVDGWPRLTSREREFLRSLVGGGVPDTPHVVLWCPDPVRRQDCATRHVLGGLLRKAFGVNEGDGWIWEGFGLYFNWRLVGTRMTWYVQTREAGIRGRTQMRTRLMSPECDWRAEAIALLRGEDAPSLEELLPKPVNDMDAREMLLAYVLTAYLVEGERAKPSEILHRVGGGEPSREVLEEILGMSPDLIQRRVQLWLEEEEPTRHLDPGQSVLAFGQPPPSAGDGARSRRRSGIEPVEWIVLEPAVESALMRCLAGMEAEERDALLGRCVEAARATGARQVELVEAWTEGAGGLADLPFPTELPAHDAREHGGGPRRELVGPGEEHWEIFRPWLLERPAPWTRCAEYEHATGLVVRTPPDPEDRCWALRNLLVGVLPGQDLAEARLLQALDRAGTLRDEARFFAHLFCDVEGRAYEGITLLDVWSGGAQLEVPDPDVRAYAKLVWGEDGLPAPLEAEHRELWYPRMARSIEVLERRLRDARTLAGTWFQARPVPEPGCETSLDLLHALIALEEEDEARLAAHLDRDGERFLEEALARVEASGRDARRAGERRRDELAAGQALIRGAVVGVLREEGVMPGAH